MRVETHDHCRTAADVAAAAARVREKRREWHTPVVAEIPDDLVPLIASHAPAPPIVIPSPDDHAVGELIAAVAAGLQITPEEMLTSVESRTAQRGRQIAAALAVRRLYLTRAEASMQIGITEATLVDALARLDPTLSRHSVSRFSDLTSVVTLVCHEFVNDAPTRGIAVREIKLAVAKKFGVRVADIDSQQRTSNIMKPRQFALALARRLTLRSLPDIGRQFGGRDHTTVLHAVRKFEPLIHLLETLVPAEATLDDWIDRGAEAMDSVIPAHAKHRARAA